MNLLDRAIKLAAEQDEPLEMNFVRKHALQQAKEMGTTLREAATRVFSNASGEGWSGCRLPLKGRGRSLLWPAGPAAGVGSSPRLRLLLLLPGESACLLYRQLHPWRLPC